MQGIFGTSKGAATLLFLWILAQCASFAGLARAEESVKPPSIDQLLAGAHRFADGLVLNAAQLESHDPPIAGKKKLAELLDLYLLLLKRETSEAGRAAIFCRLDSLTLQVRTPAYQNLPRCSAAELDANALSYLRVYVLLDRIHRLTPEDKEQIGRVKALLDESLARRGPWQREMFAEYYRRLGLALPAVLRDSTDPPDEDGPANGSSADSLSSSRDATVVSQRIPFAQYNLQRAYALTHEVFAAFDYGEREQQQRFDEEDLRYLKSVLIPLQQLTVRKQSLDLLAEVLSCRAYLGFNEDPSYRQALGLILTSQNANGSWGDYEAHREVYGDTLEVEGYLHTTLVCVQALVDVSRRN